MRSIVAAFILILLSCAMWAAARAGYSRSLASEAVNTARLEAANNAIQLSSSDPEAYLARAVVLWNSQRYDEAYKDYERAIALRPNDYYLWFRHGYAHYLVNDYQGASPLFKNAAERAPYYAQPHWLLGKTLLKLGQREEAFAELRRAAASNPVYLADVISLAFDSYDRDVQKVQRLINPQTPAERLTFAYFLVNQGKAFDAVQLFRTIDDVSEQDRREFVAELINAKAFAEAYEVWSKKRDVGNRATGIINGSFEDEIVLSDANFGWQIAQSMEGVRAFRDATEPHNGLRSLRIDFEGDSNPSAPAVSQIVLVKPNNRYRLTFAARSQELVTLGAPVVVVADANNDERVLAQSNALTNKNSNWQDYTTQFATSAVTQAVVISIKRQSCSASGSCPAFGHIWFDKFSLDSL